MWLCVTKQENDGEDNSRFKSDRKHRVNKDVLKLDRLGLHH